MLAVPYTARNTNDRKDIEYRVEGCIEEHSEGGQLRHSTPNETYSRPTGLE
jgi:hypothetical protein